MHELGLALARWHPELEPCFVLNRDLPIAATTTEPFIRYGRVAYSDDSTLPRDAIYHIPSPLEPVLIDRLWPPRLRSSGLVVTLHDLIPALFPDENMPDPAVRRAYWGRLELIRQADRVLSVSRATACDAVHLLGSRPEKVSVTGGGVSDEFRPPQSRSAARDVLQRLRPRIDAEFVLYTGGMDYRKNVDGLLLAYAGLATELRRKYKLVLVGRLGLADAYGPFAKQAESLGISDRVVFTGYVSDEELVLLYQAATLFVFPSRYEGFGLPVVEALACGAPAIVGQNSSLVELVDREEALFDAADPSSIRAALAEALTDSELLERLRRPDIRDRFSWRQIAEKTAAAYDEVARRRRPVRSRRRSVLCAAPLHDGAADGATTRLVLEALVELCDVDLVIDDQEPERLPQGLEPLQFESVERVEQLRGGYDAALYWLGNALDYALPMHLLRRRPGIVVAYNVRLTNLYSSAAKYRPDLEPRRFVDILRSIYGHRTPDGLGDTAFLDDATADRHGIYMAGEAIGLSTRFFVHFPTALSIARLEASAGKDGTIDVLPLPLPQPDPAQSPGSRERIAVFTGAGGSSEVERVVSRLRELSLETTLVSDAGSVAWEYSAAIAVKGALNATGFATFLANSLAAGTPTLLLGPSLGDNALPESVVELDAETSDVELRDAIRELKRETRAITPAEAVGSVEAVAERLYRAIHSQPDKGDR